MKSRHPQWYREDLVTLFDLLMQKKIQPVISQRLPLTEAAQAYILDFIPVGVVMRGEASVCLLVSKLALSEPE